MWLLHEMNVTTLYPLASQSAWAQDAYIFSFSEGIHQEHVFAQLQCGFASVPSDVTVRYAAEPDGTSKAMQTAA